MSSEDTLIEVRKSKHQELNGGNYPLNSNKSSFDSIEQVNYYITANGSNIKTSILPEELGKNLILHGRITAMRKSGSITFIKLSDQTGAIQLIASKAALSTYANLRLLDLGDIVEVIGKPCLSKTGEKSILVISWELLTKAHRPLPEKYVGITDNELKQRKRYLDLLSSQETKAVFTIRSYTLRALRNYMESQDFLEVETSTLNTISSGANAKPFTTHHNSLDMNLYLRIAPELYLKRLVVGGFDKVFEIGRNYRNEGISTRHNPEFTMMEFYQAYANFSDLVQHTKKMFSFVDTYLSSYLPKYAKEYYQQCYNNRSFSFSEYKQMTMIDSVIEGLNKISYVIGDDFKILMMLAGTTEEQNARRQKIDFKSLRHELDVTKSVGERIAILFEYVVEPFLVEDYRTEDGKYSCPVFITEYPKDICPLARANDKNPLICDRFELFVNGRELCNAFQELNNPDEQALRFKEQLQINDKDPMDYDSDYVEALEIGMPPTAGFGMGVDRLIMLLTNSESIRDVILFPTLRPENR